MSNVSLQTEIKSTKQTENWEPLSSFDFRFKKNDCIRIYLIDHYISIKSVMHQNHQQFSRKSTSIRMKHVLSGNDANTFSTQYLFEWKSISTMFYVPLPGNYAKLQLNRLDAPWFSVWANIYITFVLLMLHIAKMSH